MNARKTREKKSIRKNERGSVTLFVLIAMMFFLTVGVGVYMTNVNTQHSQQQGVKKVQLEYENKENVDQIYNEQLEKLGQKVYLIFYEDVNNNEIIDQTDVIYSESNWSRHDIIVKINWPEGLTDEEQKKATVKIGDKSYNKIDEDEGFIISGEGKTKISVNINEDTQNVTVKIDKTAPDVQIEPNGCISAQSKSVKIIVGKNEEDKSGLSNENVYKYYLSSSETEQKDGDWIEFTSGENITIGNGITGDRYLHIKSISDNAGNETGDIISQKFIFDNTSPTAQINTQKMYVETESLVTRLDATNNANGSHSSDTNKWMDLSGNGKNGTIANGTWGENYLQFNGSSTYVNLGAINSNYQTVEATFSVDVVAHCLIIGNLHSGGGGIYVSESGYIEGEYYIKGEYKVVTSDVKVEVGNIYNASLTYNGSEVVLYVNGIKKQTIGISGTIGAPINSTYMALGVNPRETNGTDGAFLSGKIYNAAVYSSALTAAEVRQNAQAGMAQAGGITNASSITYTFIWDEILADGTFTTDDITVTNGTKGTFTEVIENKVYTLVVTTDENQYDTQKIEIADNICTDIAGNKNIAASKEVKIDRIIPNVMINTQNMYVQTSSLVTRLDATNNANGSHSSNTSKWMDISGNGKNGTIANGTWGENYLQFNGSSTYVNLGAINSNYQTVEATFSIDEVTESKIIANYDVGGIGIYISSGYIGGSCYINGSYIIINSNIKVEVGKIYHASITYDGREVILYINGIKQGSVPVNGTIGAPTNSTYMALGVNPSGPDNNNGDFLNGKIYNAAVYSSALTAAQVKLNAQAGMAQAGGTTNASSITYTFTWSENLADGAFTADDITVTNGTKGAFTATTENKVYTLVVTTADGQDNTQKVEITADKSMDIAGNGNVAINKEVKIDKKAPQATASPKYKIDKITSTGYDVYVYGITDTTGVDRVEFTTWADNNGEDYKKSGSDAKGVDKGNGEWYYRVNITDHNNEYGKYHTHIYTYDTLGNYECILELDNIQVPAVKVTYDIGNMNDVKYWQYQYLARFNTTYDSAAGLNTIVCTGNAGWEMFYLPIKTEVGRTYTISFDYQNPNGYNTYSTYEGIGYQALTAVSDSNNSNNSLATKYLAKTALTERTNLSLEFTATTTTTYFAFNFGMAADGATTTIKLGNFKITEGLKYGDALGSLPELALPGTTFNGYYTQANGAGTKITTATIVPATDITYYAKSTANTYTVVYDGNVSSEAEELFDVSNISWKTKTVGGITTTISDDGTISFAGTYDSDIFDRAYFYTEKKSKLIKAGNYLTLKNTNIGSTTWVNSCFMIYFYRVSDGSVVRYFGDFNLTHSSNTILVEEDMYLYGLGFWCYRNSNLNGYKAKLSLKIEPIYGSMGNSSHTYGEEKNLTSNAYIRTGYTFKEWNTKADGTGKSFTDGQKVKNLSSVDKDTVKLYAQWSANQYTVKYDGNGSTSGTMTPSTHTYDTASNLTANGFTKTGYSFTGWNTKADGTGTSYANLASVKNLTSTSGGSVTLYAQWKANGYTIAFNSNDGTGTMSNITTTYDKDTTLTANAFSKKYTVKYSTNGGSTVSDGVANQIFMGWTLGGKNMYKFTNLYSTNNTTVNNDGTLSVNVNNAGTSTIWANLFCGSNSEVTANTKYVNILDIKSKTITGSPVYYPSNDSTSETAQILSSSAYNVGNFAVGVNHMNITSKSTITGHGFFTRGFFSIYSGTSLNIKYRPILVKGTYSNVPLYYYNNAVVRNLTATDDSTVTLYADWGETTVTLPTPTKTGYTFAGWYNDSALTSKAGNGGSAYRPSKDITLYAKWTANNYTVKIDPNGGTLNGSTSVTSNTIAYGSTKAPGTPTRTGYTFGGWVPTKIEGTDNATWVEVFYHNNNSGSTLFSSDSEAQSSNTRDKYSILNQLETFRANSSSAFEFLLKYDELGSAYNRWTQTSNPTTSTSISGYTAKTNSWTGNNWGGIAKSTNSTYTFIDGSPSHIDWWYAIGSKAAYQGGIPGPNDIVVKQGTSLWVKANSDLSNITKSVTGVLDSSGNYIVRHDVTLKAIWIPNTYTIKYDNNYLNNTLIPDTTDISKYTTHGTSWSSITTTQDTSVANGAVVEITMNSGTVNGPYKIGVRLTEGTTYTWSVYVKASSAKTLLIGHEQNGRKTVNVTTNWQRITHTFTADSNGYNAFIFYLNGSTWTAGDKLYIHSLEISQASSLNISTQSKTYGTTLGTLSTPTRTGYTFAGWYTAPIGGTQISAETAVPAANTTYYAHWTANKYYLDLNGTLNGTGAGNISGYGTSTVYINGKSVSSGATDYYTQWPYGTTYKVVTTANTGYTVASGATLSGRITSYTDVRPSINPNTYTIKYDGNGSTSGSTASSTHTYNASKSLTANGFTKTGYSFNGWNTKADGTGTNYANSASVKNLTSTNGATVTLYAQWIDNIAPTKPSVSLKLNSSSGSTYTSGAWTNQNVFHTVTTTEQGSGIAKYQYSHDNTTWIDLPSSWTTTYNSTKTQVTYVIDWNGNWNFRVRAIDVAGNASESSDAFIVRRDATKPTITVSPTSATVCKSKSVTITAADTGGSNLSSSNSYQYYLSTSSTALNGGSWTTYTSGTAFTIGTGKTGTYYLFVKRITDNAANTSTANGTATTISNVTYQRFGSYVFDNSGPRITLSSTSATACKSKSVTITVSDIGTAGLNSSNSYQYYLSTSSTALSGGSWTTYKSGTAFTIGTGKTGTYYLFVKRVTDTLGNTSTTNGTATEINDITYQRFGSYIFDNTGPTISLTANPSYTRGNKISVTLNDSGSGVTYWGITKVGTDSSPAIEPSNTSDNVAANVSNPDWWYKTSQSSTVSVTVNFNPDKAGHYYIWCKDSVGNVSHVYKFILEQYFVVTNSGSTYYECYLGDATANATTGAVIKPLGNIVSEQNGTISVDSGKSITIDTDGKTIPLVDTKISVKGSLQVQGGGTITSNSNYYTIYVSGGTLSVSGCVIDNSAEGKGVTILGGTINVYNKGFIYGKTAIYSAVENSVINIFGGMVGNSSSTSTAIYSPNQTCTINIGTKDGNPEQLLGPTLYGLENTINVKKGSTVNFYGGTIYGQLLGEYAAPIINIPFNDIEDGHVITTYGGTRDALFLTNTSAGAEIGDIQFDNIKTAILCAGIGEEANIKQLLDYENDEVIKVCHAQKICLEGMAKSITYTGTEYAINNYGDLTLNTSYITAPNGIRVYRSSDLTLKGGSSITINSTTGNGIYISESNITASATISIENSLIKAENGMYGIRDSNSNNSYMNTIQVIGGSLVRGKNGIYSDYGSNITVDTGGRVQGTTNVGIQTTAGTVNVIQGTIYGATTSSGKGIQVTTATINLGSNDGSVLTTAPIIRGYYGIQKTITTSGSINFYDGKVLNSSGLTGTTYLGSSYAGTINKPSGYSLSCSSDNKTITLSQ